MVIIQILHRSLLGYVLSIYIKYYLKKYLFKIKIVSGKHLKYKYRVHTYFIIKSSFLKSEQVDELLKEIRMRYVQSHIILIGSHINYEEIYKNHYRVFGVIDTTTNQSFKFIFT
ncbi:hypothetical protein ACJBW9_01225 [Streptococcus suis]